MAETGIGIELVPTSQGSGATGITDTLNNRKTTARKGQEQYVETRCSTSQKDSSLAL